MWTGDRSREDRLEAQELRSIVDAELERLPAQYRAPVILCDLEGQTHEQAAAQLGCPVGTVKSRLSRGREQLRSRLVRRGVAPSAGLLAATLAAESAHAVPVELIHQTLGAATQARGRPGDRGRGVLGRGRSPDERSACVPCGSMKTEARRGRPGGGRPRHDRRPGPRRPGAGPARPATGRGHRPAPPRGRDAGPAGRCASRRSAGSSGSDWPTA